MIASAQNEAKQKHGKLPQITPAQLRPAGLGWKPAKGINKAGDPAHQKSVVLISDSNSGVDASSGHLCTTQRKAVRTQLGVLWMPR